MKKVNKNQEKVMYISNILQKGSKIRKTTTKIQDIYQKSEENIFRFWKK